MTRAERRAKRELEREFKHYVLAPEPPRSRWWAWLRPILVKHFGR